MALGAVSHDPAELVLACRQLIEHRPSSGPLVWLAARMLTGADPGNEAWDASEMIQRDKTVRELEHALHVLSTFDEGPDLVLYYKYLLVLLGDKDFTLHFNPTDELTPSQAGFAEAQLNAFLQWWENWPGKDA